MKNLRAATVTIDDLKMYFKHGGEDPLKRRGAGWRSRAADDGSFHAESPTYEVDLSPKGAVFLVKVEAVDDPSDSDEQVTDAPTKFLVDFLKTGTAGDSVFGKMAGFMRRTDSFGPDEVSGVLRIIADEAESGRLTLRQAAHAIRRASLLPGSAISVRIAGLAESRHALETGEMDALQKEMEAKGWRTKVAEDPARGLPSMEVDISGVYKAQISVDHVSWHFRFQLAGIPETLSEGVTDDPIEEFERFFKDPATKEARKDAEARSAEEAAASEDDITVPPPRRS